MKYNQDKVDEATLALLYLNMWDENQLPELGKDSIGIRWIASMKKVLSTIPRKKQNL